jgi:hypothetical protein
MDTQRLIEVLNQELVAQGNRPLNSAETALFLGIWQYRTYNEIAAEASYSTGYLTNVVAPELMQRLSQLVGQRLTKKNCRTILEPFLKSRTLTEVSEWATFPSGPISLDSPFYVSRSQTEAQIFAEILKPGSLVRLKAPREMGKTSLLLRVLNQAAARRDRTVYLSLEQIDQELFESLNRFLRWLSASVSRQLDLEPKLDDYWDPDIGSKVSCTLYFRSHILPQIQAPLVLVLDEVNQLFEHPQIAKDVLPLLRSWYEEAKRIPIWKNLRLVIAHSTEVYVPLQLNQSPFNVGLAAQLTDFSLEQVQQLAQAYGLAWQHSEDAQRLMGLVGGHPALIHIAIYHLSQDEIALDDLLAFAATSTGIYHHHLQRHWMMLQEQPELIATLKLILENGVVTLEPAIAHKLTSMGIVHQVGNTARISYPLYEQYFQAILRL